VDNDTQAIVVNPASLTILEGDPDGADLVVNLAFNPMGTVVVNIATSNDRVARPRLTQLRFDSSDYAIGKPVSIWGVNDNTLIDPRSANITFSSAVTANTVIPITVNNDDAQAYEFTPPAITNLLEGNQVQLWTRLRYRPNTEPVVVSVQTGATEVVTHVPSSLSFTQSNWMIAQPILVTAEQDVDLVPGFTTIEFDGRI
jgi:hypothetical protein